MYLFFQLLFELLEFRILILLDSPFNFSHSKQGLSFIHKNSRRQGFCYQAQYQVRIQMVSRLWWANPSASGGLLPVIRKLRARNFWCPMMQKMRTAQDSDHSKEVIHIFRSGLIHLYHHHLFHFCMNSIVDSEDLCLTLQETYTLYLRRFRNCS